MTINTINNNNMGDGGRGVRRICPDGKKKKIEIGRNAPPISSCLGPKRSYIYFFFLSLLFSAGVISHYLSLICEVHLT